MWQSRAAAPEHQPANTGGRRPRLLIAGALGWLAGLATVGAAGLLVVATGAFDVAASTPHTRLVAWALHTTMQNSVEARAGASPQAEPFTGGQVREGARIFDRDCVGCHGAPGVGRERWVSGLTPTPPYLIDAARRWAPGELYWIVRNGVKMTAMPAWGEQYSRGQLLDIVAFLSALPTVTPQAYARMRADLTASGDAPAAGRRSSPPCALRPDAPADVEGSCTHG